MIERIIDLYLFIYYSNPTMLEILEEHEKDL